VTVTVEPTFLSPLTFVLAVRVNVPHLFPAVHRDFVARDRDDFSSHLAVCVNAALLSVRLAAAIAMRIDFIFIMALNPGILPTQAFMRAVR
jgi:hypothetical protein